MPSPIRTRLWRCTRETVCELRGRAPAPPGWFPTLPVEKPSPDRSREVYDCAVSNGQARLDEPPFGCAVVQGADRCEIRLEGEIDLAARPALDDALQTVLGVDGVGEVALDLQAVTFADSSAVAWLLAADRRIRTSGRRMTIVACSATVRGLLRITGLNGRFALVDRS